MQKQVLTFLFLSAVLLALTQVVTSDEVKFGWCPSGIKTVDNFNATAYLGLWYEYAKYPVIFESGGKCMTAQYGALGSDEISVVNSQISTSNELKTINGTAKIVAPGKLSVRFENLAAISGAADYWILNTDYNTYAVVYSCRSMLISAHIEYLWILIREQVPSQGVVNKAKDVIVSQKLSLRPLKVTNQSDC